MSVGILTELLSCHVSFVVTDEPRGGFRPGLFVSTISISARNLCINRLGLLAEIPLKPGAEPNRHLRGLVVIDRSVVVRADEGEDGVRILARLGTEEDADPVIRLSSATMKPSEIFVNREFRAV